MKFFLADSRFPWRCVRRCSLLLFALLLIPLAASAQDTPSGFFPGAINTFAGNGSGSGSSGSSATPPINGTSPTQSGIGGTPKAMAVDSMGDVFLADNSYVWMVPSNEGATKVPPILAAVTTKACTPVNPVAGDIYQVTGYSVLSGGCGSTGSHAFAPYVNISAMWFDVNDNLYIADAGQSWSTSVGYDVNEIIQDTTSGTVTVKIIAGTAGQSGSTATNGTSPTSIMLGAITDVKTDSFGNVYIVDGNSNSVVYAIYMSDATAPPPVLAAEGVTPTKGAIYIIAGSMDNYCGPSPSNPCYQDAPANSTLLSEPQSVFVDSVGNIYITDNYENVLYIIYVGKVNGAVPPVLKAAGYSSPTVGNIYVVAGTYSSTALTACTTTPCGDGQLATASTLNYPEEVLVDSTGNVYIADYNDNAIRKIDTSGYISTIAGVDNPSGTLVALSSAGAGGAATSAKLYEPSTIAFDSTGSNLYIGDSNNVVWQVEPAQAQTITFPTLESSATYGDKVTLGATASSGLDVSYTVSPTASGSVSGTGSNAKLTVTAGSGSITVNASQGTAAGGSTAVTSATGTVIYYAPTTAAEDVTQTISTINPAPLTVTANPVSLLPSQLAAFVLSPTDTAAITLANGDLANTAAYSGAPDFQTTATASASCGTPYSITPSKGSLTSTNYDFTNFVSGTVTITGTATQTINLSSTLPSAVTYGKITSVPLSATTGSGGTVTWSVLSGPGTVTTTSSSSVLNITGAGTIKVQAIQNGTCAYAASPTVTYTLTVSPAPLTVTAPSPSYPYGTNITTALAATAPTITGWVGSDTSALVSGSPVYTTSATSTSDPNSFTLSVAQGYLAVASNAAANYTLVAPTATYTSGTITITKASQSIGYVAPSSITYGDYPTVTASANSNTTSASSGLAVTASATGALTAQGYSGSTFNFNASGTGAGTITLTQAGNTDYAAATPVVLTFTVAQAPLYINANSYTREQGAANPTFTYTIGCTSVIAASAGCFQNGDTDIPSVVSGIPVLTTTATQASPQGTYTVSVDTSAMTSTNYQLVPKNGTLTVGQAGTYVITANPSSLTIQRGLSAQSTITITPSNDYQGTITLTCGTLPANVTCTVSPSTYTFTGEFVSNGNVVAEQPQKGIITINTTSATVVGANSSQKSNVSLAGFLISGAFAGLFLLFARKRVAKIATFWSLCALLSLGIGATLGLSSCGGSSVNTTAAAGTQTITITGTGTTPSGSGAVTATVPLTVTIQ